MQNIKVQKRLLGVCIPVIVLLMAIKTFGFSGGQSQQQELFPDSYRIGAMDTLEVIIKDAPELSNKYQVTLQGEIAFSVFNATIAVLNKTAQQVAGMIADILKREVYLKTPQVKVRVVSRLQDGISISGGIRKPGTYPSSTASSLLNLLIKAGGLTECYSPVAIIRNLYDPQRSLNVSIKGFFKGNLSTDVKLQAGDIVYIPEEECILIGGEVSAPGRYRFKEGMTLKMAINLAGGTTSQASSDKVFIFPDTSVPNGQSDRIINLTEILKGTKPDVLLHRRDYIVIPGHYTPRRPIFPNFYDQPNFKEFNKHAPFKLRYS